MKSISFLGKLLIIAYLLSSCASQTTPDGGPSDPDPPELVSANPPNNSVNFDKQSISIEFDKYIQLENVLQELVVSPPLESLPEVTKVGKTLNIELEEELEENTTYTFNFGEAITSFREGNVLNDFKYVVSTGSSLDSAFIEGNIEYAFNNEPAGNVKVMLYDDLRDSAVFEKDPFYYTRSRENGDFSIGNIAPGRYRLYALEEEGANFRYDPGDKFAFYEDTLVVEDTMRDLNLRMFEEELREPRLIDWDVEHRGKINLDFNRKSDELEVSMLSDRAGKKYRFFKEWLEEGKLTLWHFPYDRDSVNFILYEGEKPFDTLGINYQNDSLPEDTVIDFDLKAEKARFPKDPVFFEGENPLRKSHKEKVNVLKDSQDVISSDISFYPEGLRNGVQLNFPKEYQTEYVIYLEEGAFCDFFHKCNDSSYHEVTTYSRSELGVIEVEANLSQGTEKALVQLVQGGTEDEEIVRQKVINESGSVVFKDLLPGNYRVKGVIDEGDSGNWTTGSFAEKRQPEKVLYLGTSLNLRANWELRDNVLEIGE